MAKDRDGPPPYQPVFPRCGMGLGAATLRVGDFGRQVIGIMQPQGCPATTGRNTGTQMPQWTLALGARHVAIAEDPEVLQFSFKPQASLSTELFQWQEEPDPTARAAAAYTRLAGEARAAASASLQQASKHHRASLSQTVGPVGAHMQVAGPLGEAAAASVLPLRRGQWARRA